MRETDLDRLRTPYPNGLAPGNSAVRACLDVATPNVDALTAEILGDLDEQRFGIAWWGGTSTGRRILVSDQLYACTSDVADNILEARLHEAEANQGWDQFKGRFTPAGPGPNPQVQFPIPKAPSEQLPLLLAALHTAGFFRAIGSALDCLAGAMIGVAALPLNILKVDLGTVRQHLTNAANAGPTPPEHLALAAVLEGAIKSAGPTGWLDWSLDMRNMLVHRGCKRRSKTTAGAGRKRQHSWSDASWLPSLLPGV